VFKRKQKVSTKNLCTPNFGTMLFHCKTMNTSLSNHTCQFLTAAFNQWQEQTLQLPSQIPKFQGYDQTAIIAQKPYCAGLIFEISTVIHQHYNIINPSMVRNPFYQLLWLFSRILRRQTDLTVIKEKLQQC